MSGIAENSLRDADRIAACRLAGIWCGWEKEEEKPAGAGDPVILQGLRDLMHGYYTGRGQCEPGPEGGSS
jgi:hypothetical protein